MFVVVVQTGALVYEGNPNADRIVCACRRGNTDLGSAYNFHCGRSSIVNWTDVLVCLRGSNYIAGKDEVAVAKVVELLHL
jgi:hypothetical protein